MTEQGAYIINQIQVEVAGFSESHRIRGSCRDSDYLDKTSGEHIFFYLTYFTDYIASYAHIEKDYVRGKRK